MENNFQPPEGYDRLKDCISRFFKENPDYETNVFISMEFDLTPPIYKAIHDCLCEHGLNPLRADKKAYNTEVWGNICTYMICCSKAIVVFEDIHSKDIIAMEYGFMLALNRQCLKLKEKRYLKQQPVDISGHVWKEFDSSRPIQSISDAINKWLVDINWKPRSPKGTDSILRCVKDEAVAFHNILENFNHEFELEITFDEKAAKTLKFAADLIVAKGTIFRESAFDNEFSKTNEATQEILSLRRKVAENYIKKVQGPLENYRGNPKAGIKNAAEGIKEVIEEDYALIKKIEELSP